MALDINMPFAQELIAQGRARGYNDLQISQILGSAAQENNFKTDGRPGDNGTAFGGFQWRLDREKALRDKANQAGVDWTDPRIQATHWYDELDTGQESPRGRALRAAQTPEEAQRAVIGALRPQHYTPQAPENGHGWANRLNNGKQIYSMLAGGGGASAPTGNPSDILAGGGAAPVDPDAANKPTPNAMQAAFQAGKPGFAVPPAAEPSAWDKLKNFLTGGKPYDFAGGLQGAGIAMMARDNPAGASAMANGMNAQTASNKPPENKVGQMIPGTFNKETGRGLFFGKDGQPVAAQVEQPFKKLGEKELEGFNERQDRISEYDNLIREGDKYRNLLAEGKINLSLVGQGETAFNNLTNQSSEADRNAAGYWRYLEQMRNASLNLAKGVQTDKDAARVMNEYVSGSGKYDNAQSIKALDNVLEKKRRAAASTINAQETVLNTYGDQAPKGTYRDDYKRYREEWDGFEKSFAPKRQEFFKRLETERNAAPAETPRAGVARPQGGNSASSSGGSLRDKILRDNGR